MEALPSSPSHFPKPPLPNAINLGCSNFNMCICGAQTFSLLVEDRVRYGILNLTQYKNKNWRGIMGKEFNTHKHEIKVIFHYFVIQIESEK